MITIRPASERGHANHGWLDAHHSFSFANYRDPQHMGFGTLRVLNQDRIAPAAGFPPHGHADMEIVTYVLRGVLEHRDSMGHGSRITPEDVQLMGAGTGVTHSEYNGSQDEELELLQMWVLPAARGTEPRYEQRSFPREERRGGLRLLVSPDGADGSLVIGQEARLYAAVLESGETARLDLAGDMAWVHVAHGAARLGSVRLRSGDGAAVRGEDALELEGLDAAELVVWRLPDPESHAS